MTTIEQAQQQAQQARELLQQKQREAEDAQRQLEEQRRQTQARITAESLRQGSLSGLQGREQRSKIQNVISNIQSQQQEVKEYSSELSQYEQQQLKPYEQQIQSAIEQQNTINKLQRAYEQGKLWAYAGFGNEAEKEIAKSILNRNKLSGYVGSNFAPQQAFSPSSVPFGYSPPSVLDIYSKYQKELAPQISKMSQYEQNQFITSLPSYKAEIQTIFNQPDQQVKMESYKKTAGFGGYGTGTLPSLSFIGSNAVLQNVPESETTGGIFGKISRKISEANAKRLIPVSTETNYKQYITPEEAFKQRSSTSSFKELYQNRDLPAIVYKSFQTGGEKTSAFVGKNLFRRELTPAEQRTAGRIIGETALVSTFAPVFSTGTTAQLEANEEVLYDYVKGKWVRKNKITGKISELKVSPEEFASNIRQDLIEKPAGEEQVRYLNQLYERFYKFSPEGKENFKKLVQKLYEEGTFKGIPLDFIEQTKQEAPLIYEVVGRVPQMSNIGSGGLFLSKLPQTKNNIIKQSNQAQKEINLVNQPNRFTPLTKGLNKQQVLSKLGTLTGVSLLNGLNSSSGLKTQQKQNTNQQQKSLQKQAQSSLLKTNQAQKQVQRLRQEARQQIKQQTLKKNVLKPMVRIPAFFKTSRAPKRISHPFGDFGVFVRKGGKDVFLTSAKSEEEAFGILFGSLDKTLRASGFVGYKGTKVKPRSLPFGFRTGKYDPFRVVEKRSRRLNMPTEVSEILSYPKNKKKSFNWW